MNLAELGIILASRSLPLAVVSSGDWLRPAATRPRRSHSLVFVGSRWSLAAQRSGDGSGERKAEFISPGGMPSPIGQAAPNSKTHQGAGRWPSASPVPTIEDRTR